MKHMRTKGKNRNGHHKTYKSKGRLTGGMFFCTEKKKHIR